MGLKEGLQTMSLTSGENLKAKVRGVDTSRALRDCQESDVVCDETKTFRNEMETGMYIPTQMDMKGADESIMRLLRSGKIQVIIPMFEKGGPPDFVPRDVLRYLIKDCGIPRYNILVINHRSEEPAVEEALSWKVPVVNALQVMTSVAPEVMAITGLSELFAGKGIAVLAGLLTVRKLMDQNVINPDFVMFHDSELVGVSQYDGARHLCYPLVVEPDKHNHVIGAQIDRGNEAVFAARVALEALEHAHPEEQVRQYIAEMRLPLTKLVWMLTGERVLRTEDLFKLPLATGYVLETILNLGMESLNLNGSSMTTAQVVISNPRLDCCNGAWAEQCMMHTITRALNTLILQGEPPHKWPVERIAGINKIFSKMNIVPILPQEAGPVECMEKVADRVIPSIDTLFRESWIDEKILGGIVARL